MTMATALSLISGSILGVLIFWTTIFIIDRWRVGCETGDNTNRGNSMEQLKVTVSNEPSTISETRLAEAKKYARMLLGCYRTGDANDPEVYVAAVVAVLAKYPVPIMRAVCDPTTGIPSQIKWLPTVAEVVAECDRLHSYDLRLAALHLFVIISAAATVMVWALIIGGWM